MLVFHHNSPPQNKFRVITPKERGVALFWLNTAEKIALKYFPKGFTVSR